MAEKPTLAQKVLSAITGLTPQGGTPGAQAPKRTESGFRAKVDDRRRYRRLQAPVFCRPAGLRVFSKHEEQPIDLSLGGVRVYSDEELEVGQRLTLELIVKGEEETVTFDAEVAWIEALEPGAPGKYDVGLKFLHLSAENEALLTKVLE